MQEFCQALQVKEITQKQVWEDFLMGCQEKTFLNSWSWGEFQKAMGYKIWRLGIYNIEHLTSNIEQLIAVALVIKIEARRGRFIFMPHGPTQIQNSKFKIQNYNSKFKILESLIEKLKEIARQESCSFIRISPIWRRSEENIKIFRDLGFRNAPIHMHPEASWKLDITLSEEELLMQMRKTTRYLIRQAQKNKDIEIFQSSKIEDVETFNKLYQKVVQSRHFVPFSLEYLKNEFLAFGRDTQISLFFGKYRGEIVASAFVLFWSKIGFYHHAALSSKDHKIPIAYLLQWEAIKQAKKRGCLLYDFWGFVDPFKNPKHPWAGPTLFKMGFGGCQKEYVKTQDLVLSPKYWINYFIEKIRRKKRGL